MRQLRIAQQITIRESPSLEKYLHEIKKEELITPQKEVELAIKIRNGDQKALDKLVKANTKFVVSVAKQYQNQGSSLPDLINDGNLGLIKAAQRFDETKGFKFISYAVWWIRQSILQALAEHSKVVRLPLSQIRAVTIMDKAYAKLEQKFEREPTPDELANVLDNVAALQISFLREACARHVSLDAPLPHDENKFLIDTLESTHPESITDNFSKHESLRIDTREAMKALTLRQNAVITMYYGLDGEESMTLEEIGEYFDITRERARQIMVMAQTRLKKRSPQLKFHLSAN